MNGSGMESRRTLNGYIVGNKWDVADGEDLNWQIDIDVSVGLEVDSVCNLGLAIYSRWCL